MANKYLKITRMNGVATITLNRPEKRNALSPHLFEELNRELEMLSGDMEVGALVITGGETVFSAGMDIAEMVKLKPEESYHFWNYGYNITFEKIYNFRVPTIAAVSGFALAGGFDLAVSCDFRIASDTAVFGQLEVDVGLSPGIDRLWRLVGLSRAKYLGLTSERIDVQEAYRIGLVDKICKAGNLLQCAQEWSNKFASKPRQALEKAKQSYINVINMDHEAAINYETLLLCHLFNTDERKAIMQKFMKK